jgi:hypothetical protein
MKTAKTMAVLSAMMCLAFATANAQSVIKVNPIGLAFGSINADYEKFLNDKTSFQIGANFISRKIDDVRYTGFGVQAQYRWYLTKNDRPKGLFVGPTAAFNFVGYDDNFAEESDNYSFLAIGGLIGYQWVFGENFTFEAGIGPNFGIPFSDVDDDAFGTGVYPQISLALGYILK